MASIASWRKISEFVRIIAFTGFARSQRDTARPQSLLLLSNPGEGKTSLLERFRVNTFIEFYSDITYQQFLPILKRSQAGRSRFVCITEFQKVLARRRSVSANLLSVMSMAMEEGVYKVAYGPVEKQFDGARVGLLAASTISSMKRHPYLIYDIAMDSRCYFVDASETLDELLVMEKRMASGNRSLLSPVVIDTPDREVIVDLPSGLSDKLRRWTAEMRRVGVRVYGLRSLARFMYLLRGVALADGKETVRRSHFEEAYEFRNLWLQPPPLPGDDGE